MSKQKLIAEDLAKVSRAIREWMGVKKQDLVAVSGGFATNAYYLYNSPFLKEMMAKAGVTSLRTENLSGRIICHPTNHDGEVAYIRHFSILGRREHCDEARTAWTILDGQQGELSYDPPTELLMLPKQSGGFYGRGGHLVYLYLRYKQQSR